MAEEFTLSVSVDADMQKFRQTLRQELDAAARQQATVPVGATAGAAGVTTVPPGGAGVSPAASVTASTVAQQSAQAAATAAARAGLPPPATAATAAATGNITLAAYGRAFYTPTPGAYAAPPAPGAPGINPGANFGAAPVVDPGANFGAGTPGPSAQQWWNYFGGGQGGAPQTDPQQRRYNQRIRALYFANAGARLFSNETEYGKNIRMAGSDPQELIAADIKYRQGIADAFPIAGRIGMALNDMFTGGTEPIERTLRDAERQDTRTAGLQRTEAMAERFRVAEGAAGLRGAEQSRFLVHAQFDKDVQTIRDERRKTADESSAKFRQQRDEVQDWYRKTPISQGGTEEERNRRMGDIARAENDSINNRAGKFVRMMTGAAAVRDRGLTDIQRDLNAADFANAGMTMASRLRTQGQPFFGALAQQLTAVGVDVFKADAQTRPGVAQRGLQDVAESFVNFARDFGHEQRSLTAQNRINQKLLDRDPLGARIAAVEAQRDEALEKADDLPWGFRQLRQTAIRMGAGLQERLLRRDDDDARYFRVRSLDNRREHFDLLAENKPYSARARDIQRDTEDELEAAKRSGKSSAEERKKIVEAGLAEEKSFESQLRRRMNAGYGTEVAAGSYAPGLTGGNGVEPIVNAIKETTKSINDLKALLAGTN